MCVCAYLCVLVYVYVNVHACPIVPLSDHVCLCLSPVLPACLCICMRVSLYMCVCQYVFPGAARLGDLCALVKSPTPVQPQRIGMVEIAQHGLANHATFKVEFLKDVLADHKMQLMSAHPRFWGLGVLAFRWTCRGGLRALARPPREAGLLWENPSAATACPTRCCTRWVVRRCRCQQIRLHCSVGSQVNQVFPLFDPAFRLLDARSEAGHSVACTPLGAPSGARVAPERGPSSAPAATQRRHI